jgi:hypothetical protein
MTRRPSVVRPVVASTEIVTLGALAHAGAGGTVPGAAELVALGGLVMAVSVALHHRLLHVGVAAALATSGQLLLHVLGSAPGGHGAHGAHTAHQLPLATVAAEPFTAWQMALAHLLSAAVTVAALVWQEQLVPPLRAVLRPEHGATPPSYATPRPPARTRPLGATAVRLHAPAPHRGPPTALASPAS